MRVTDIAFVLIFACIACQFVQVNSLRDRGGKAQTDGKRKGKGQRNEGGRKGRFSLSDGARCSWTAAREGDALVLGITCKRETETFGCEYVAKPKVCQQYESNTKTYWKQIGHSLRKQKSLCRDSTAVIRAGVCRSAHADAHFILKDTRPTRIPLTEGNGCPDRVEKLKWAEKYCSRSWSSVCTFIMLMFENDECS